MKGVEVSIKVCIHFVCDFNNKSKSSMKINFLPTVMASEKVYCKKYIFMNPFENYVKCIKSCVQNCIILYMHSFSGFDIITVPKTSFMYECKTLFTYLLCNNL